MESGGSFTARHEDACCLLENRREKPGLCCAGLTRQTYQTVFLIGLLSLREAAGCEEYVYTIGFNRLLEAYLPRGAQEEKAVEFLAQTFWHVPLAYMPESLWRVLEKLPEGELAGGFLRRARAVVAGPAAKGAWEKFDTARISGWPSVE